MINSLKLKENKGRLWSDSKLDQTTVNTLTEKMINLMDLEGCTEGEVYRLQEDTKLYINGVMTLTRTNTEDYLLTGEDYQISKSSKNLICNYLLNRLMY